MLKTWAVGVCALACGMLVGRFVLSPSPVERGSSAHKLNDDTASTEDVSCRRANENLTASIHECDRRLAALGEKPVEVKARTSRVPEPDVDDAGRPHIRRPVMTPADWTRMAEAGVVRVRVPCLRDQPWKPDARAIERLALKPEAVDVIASAYAASHRRLTDQIKPLCSAVLGDAASAERVGPTVCIAAIQANARRGDPSAARAALANVARAEAAERPLVPAPDASVLEKLASAIVNEPRAFKKELADKLGDADATRLATSPDLCGDWQVLNAGETRDGNRASPSGG